MLAYLVLGKDHFDDVASCSLSGTEGARCFDCFEMGQQTSDNGCRWRMRVVGLDEGSLEQLTDGDGERRKNQTAFRLQSNASSTNKCRRVEVDEKMVFGKKVWRRGGRP